MLSENADEARQAAQEAIRRWPNLAELVEFALARHGYMNSDAGITYPDDLDAFDRDVLVLDIPDGYVEATAKFGDKPSRNYLILEQEYLELLRQALSDRGMNNLADTLTENLRPSRAGLYRKAP